MEEARSLWGKVINYHFLYWDQTTQSLDKHSELTTYLENVKSELDDIDVPECIEAKIKHELLYIWSRIDPRAQRYIAIFVKIKYGEEFMRELTPRIDES